MAVSPDSVLVRGTPVLGLLHFVEKELTPEKKRIVCQQVAEPWGARFAANLVIASDRVPLSAVNRLCTLAAQARGEGAESFGERAGLFGAREGISTVFKPFFYILSVANALSIAPLMWTRIYENGGQMRVDSRGRSADIRITGFPGDPAGCARISGWFRYIGELSGARNLACRHDVCTAKGAEADVWQFTWE